MAAGNQMGRGEATSGTTAFPCVSDAKYAALCFFPDYLPSVCGPNSDGV